MEELAEGFHEGCHVVFEIFGDIHRVQRVEDFTEEVGRYEQCFESILVVDVCGNGLHCYLGFALVTSHFFFYYFNGSISFERKEK